MVYVLKARLAGLHIHDNDCHNDSHAIPYTMNMDTDGIFAALKEVGYQGDITLEIARYPYMPAELLLAAMQFAASVGNYLRKKLV